MPLFRKVMLLRLFATVNRFSTSLSTPKVRNTLVTDMLSLTLVQENNPEENIQTYDENLKAAKVLTDLRQCIEQRLAHSPCRAPLLSHLTIDGLTYSVSSKHQGNSCIMLDAGPSLGLLPARLDYIVELQTNEDISTFIAVRQYQPFPRRDDPFTCVPLLHTRLCMPELAPLELYTIDKIRSHFAMLSLVYKEKDVVVAVSLHRVRFINVLSKLELMSRLRSLVLDILCIFSSQKNNHCRPS